MADFNAHFGITNLRAYSESWLGASASEEHDSSGYNMDDTNFTPPSLEDSFPHNSSTFPYNDIGFQSEISPVCTFSPR